MSPGWLRRRLSSRERSPASRSERIHVDGCPVVLQRLDTAQREDRVIEVLTERYEVEALDQVRYRIVVDDARFADEAVVRLACLLDEIDPNWQERFAWPEANAG
jgi:hypothetical protein